MNYTLHKTSIIGIFVLISLILPAQNSDIMPDRSAESRTSAELRYYPIRNLKLSVEQQLRFDDNISVFDKTFTEFNVRYRFWNQLDLGIGYRYIFLNDNHGQEQGIERYHRVHYYISHQFKLKRFEIENRINFQSRKEILDKSIDCLKETRNYWRFKSGLNYNIRKCKFDPFFSAEILLPTNQWENKLHNRYRLSIGTDIKLSKKQKISVEYMFDREIKNWNPEVFHIIQINYIFTIKKKS